MPKRLSFFCSIEAAKVALNQGNKVLDNISEHHYENDAIIAHWNDWKARDQRAKIERTYNKGRFRS